MQNPTYITLMFLLFSFASFAQVGDDLVGLYDEDELITIATGTAKEVRFAPSVATVITARDIKTSGAKTLDQALEMVPGLHVSASFNRQDAIYSIRGIHTGQNPQVLLLIDGVRVDQLFSGARPPNYLLPVANIERIEVIRGPGSAVYGADAFAGVISVTTKTAQHQSGNEVGTSSGSFGSREVWLNSSGHIGDLQVSASFQHVKTDGDTDRVISEDAQSQAIGVFNQGQDLNSQASLAPGSMATNHELINSKIKISADSWGLDLFSWHLANAGLGTGGFQSLDPIGTDKIDFSGASFSTKDWPLNNDWSLQGKLDATFINSDTTFMLRPPGSKVEFPSEAGLVTAEFSEGMLGNPSGFQKNYSGELVSYYRGNTEHNLRFSLGFRYQQFTASETKNFAITNFMTSDFESLVDVTGTAEVYAPDKNREHYSFSIQDEWRFANDWELTAGLRYDTFNQFGDSVNPRLALVWSTAYNLTTKFLYGRAFRAPSFGELYAQNNPSLIGNANLAPEVIDTYEIAFDYRPSYDLDLKLNVFYYKIKDLIDVQFGTPASNALKQSGHGFELEMVWRPSDVLSIVSNYAWQNAEDDVTSKQIANAPKQQFYLRSVWALNQTMTASSVVNWVADRARAPGDTRSAIDDYTSVDLVLQYSPAVEGLDISLVGRNIFDEDMREPSTSQFLNAPEIPNDYPLEGRSIHLEFTYQFGS